MAVNEQEKKVRASHLPEHGPIAENGKEVLLSVKNIDITFGKGEDAVKAVKNASFDIYKGETFSLVGESGSGKTTIGRAVIRVNPCAAGEIDYKGVKISGKIPHSLDREVIRNIQMVFQDPAASLNERATVDYIISEGLYNFHLFENEADRVKKVENIIEEVGLLPEHLTRYPHEFSGGQRQRIGLARAMVMEPELVVADEPISALDVSIRAQVLNLLKKFQEEKQLTYLFIAHDLSIVRFISDRIGVIYKGTIVEVAEAEELFNFPLHPYTHSLISAIPIPDPQLEKNKVLYTYDPSIHDYSEDKPEFVNIGHGSDLHSGCHSHHLGIPLSHLPHDRGKNVRPVCFYAFVFRKTRGNLKGFCPMEARRMAFCRSIAFALLGKYMKEHGQFLLPGCSLPLSAQKWKDLFFPLPRPSAEDRLFFSGSRKRSHPCFECCRYFRLSGPPGPVIP